MIKSYKKLFILLLGFLISASMVCLQSAFAEDSNVNPNQIIKLKEAINNASSSIKLEGGVSITKSKKLITLSLADTDVKQVLRMFADKAGLNIIFDKSVEGTVTLDLVNVTLDKAFEYVLTINNLSYWVDGSTLIIASKEAAGTLGLSQQEIMPIKIKYLDASKVANFLNTNIFSLKKPNLSSKPIVVTNPRKNEILIFGSNNDVELAKKVIANLDTKPEIKTFKVNHMTPGQMAQLVCKNVFSTEGTDAGQPDGKGGGKLACEGKQNVTADSLKSLEDNAFTVTSYPDLGTLTVYGATQEQIAMTQEFIKTTDKKQPQAYIEMSIIELSEAGSKALSSTWAYYNGKFGIDGGYSATSTGAVWDGTTGTPLERTIKMVVVDPVTKELAFAEGKIPGGFTYAGGRTPGNYNGIGYNNVTNAVYNTTLSQHISALVTQNKGRTLANPRLIVTNNKTSTIDLTTDYLKSRTTTVETTTAGTLKTTNYETGEAGITIDIKPTISPDGFITLDIKPEYSTVQQQIKEGNDIVLTFLNNRKLDLQGIKIKDGETLVVGGLMQETQTKSTQKIPGLGDLPVLGSFFRATTSDKAKSELIIMVTPKILKDAEENI